MSTTAIALPDIGALAGRLRGHRLPGGQYSIEVQEALTVARLVQSSHPAHPVFSSIASLKALGVSIDELCALCSFELAAGPMLGEFAVCFSAPLRPGVRYGVCAVIDDLERTQSRRLGVVDRLRFSVYLNDPDRATAAEIRYTWLLPRGSAST